MYRTMTRRRRNRLLIALAVTIAVAAGLFAWWRMAVAGQNTPPGSDIGAFPVTGIDVSAHNGAIDFKAVRNSGIDFVIIKATEGGTFKDRSFHRNYRQARRAGLMTGAYHFFRFDTPGELQAINLLNSMRGKSFDLPAVIDVEEWTNPDNQLPQSVVRRLRDMTDYLHERGVEVMVYSNREGYDKFLSEEFSDCELWICSLRHDHPEHNWRFWQYTHRGRIDGIDGAVDMNVFNGDTAAWDSMTRAWAVEIH